jgi:hypothetical protein
MSFDQYTILRDRLAHYGNVNFRDFTALRENLSLPENARFREAMAADLDAALSTDEFTQSEYEALTEEEFESEAEYRAYLARLRDFLFAGGPHP